MFLYKKSDTPAFSLSVWFFFLLIFLCRENNSNRFEIEFKNHASQRIRKVIELHFQEQATSTIQKLIRVVSDYVALKGEYESR